ncbi:hypothetical protein D3C80_534690 [compost metagenome]
MVLEHNRTFRSGRVDLSVLQEHGAIRNRCQTGDQVEQGRFPAARVTDYRDEFALVDGEVDVFQHFCPRGTAIEILVDVVELEISVHENPLNWPRCRG